MLNSREHHCPYQSSGDAILALEPALYKGDGMMKLLLCSRQTVQSGVRLSSLRGSQSPQPPPLAMTHSRCHSLAACSTPLQYVGFVLSFSVKLHLGQCDCVVTCSADVMMPTQSAPSG